MRKIHIEIAKRKSLNEAAAVTASTAPTTLRLKS